MSGNSAEAIRVLVFDDDPDIRACWEILSRQERLECFSQYESWESFLRSGDPGQVPGAVAFVDNNFEKAASEFSGVHIAMKLRELGVRSIYSISSNPQGLGEHRRLFDAVLGTKFPKNLRVLIGGKGSE